MLTLYRRFHYLANVKPLKAIPLASHGIQSQWRESHCSSSNSSWSALFKQQSKPLSLSFSMKISWIFCFLSVEQSISPRFWRNSKNALASRRPRFALISGISSTASWGVAGSLLRSSVLWPATWHSWAPFINRWKQPPSHPNDIRSPSVLQGNHGHHHCPQDNRRRKIKPVFAWKTSSSLLFFCFYFV